MIYIVLRAPNGDGTFSPVLGLTTGDTAQTINGVLCVPGCINKSSVSKLSDSMDISQAKGGVPQGIQWSFDLIDWTGAARRSAGLLNGGTRFVGWRAALYISRRGDNSTPSPVCGSADYFAINGCSSSDGVVQLKCIAAWALDASLVSFKSGTQSVGLVVGGHAVSVPTEELPEPTTIYRRDWAGVTASEIYAGVPSSPLNTFAQKFKASRKDDSGFPSLSTTGRTFVFTCADELDALDIYNKVVDSWERVVIIGKTYAEKVASIEPGMVTCGRFLISGAWAFYIAVSTSFYDGEDAEDVSLAIADVSRAITAGAGAFLGFEENGILFSPIADTNIETASGILSITPTTISTSLGIPSTSVVDFTLGWKAGFRPYGTQVKYYGNTDAIGKVPSDHREYSEYDPTTLESLANDVYDPAVIWGLFDDNNVTDVNLPLCITPSVTDISPFSWFAVDMDLRLLIRSLVPGTITLTSPVSIPFTKYVTNPQSVTYGDLNEVYPFPLMGALSSSSRRFASLDDLNAKGSFFLRASRAGVIYMNAQIANLTLYGGADLSFGSTYAQVQPGASPWWTAPVTPGEVAAALSGNVSGPVYPSIPDGPLRTPISWGEYIAPDKTYMDAAVKICEEFWITLAETSASKDATGNELLTVPSIDMGSYTDVVTEPVIEYAPVGGAYTKKAYISNVDQAFDASRPGDFYGGWGKADDQDFGFEIWKICREAYKATGTKASETYQADGIHEEYHIGLEWMQRTRAGVNRISWLAYPPRYMTFSILDDEAPSWWSGAQVNPPKSMAGFAGYNVPAGAFTVVAKEFDPMTCEASFTVALPPLVSTGTTNRIIQTASSANDRIVQSLTATDRIIQISEA